MNATCLPPETMRRYHLGDFTDAEGSEIERHLAECQACEESFVALDDTSDSLLRHLPLAAGADEPSTPAPWLERLKAGPPSPVGEPTAATESHLFEGLDAYQLTGVLGRGGMGVVYRARHRQLNRPVAIKVISPKLMSAAEAQRRFDREIKILGQLNHPGIVAATDAGMVGRAAYLVMEWIDGVDLARLVRRAGPLGIGEACEAARQMALALAAVHAAGAVHRDVKPSNTMLDRRGRVKLLDFGLAHLASPADEASFADGVSFAEKAPETSLGRLLGTFDFMAPEQASGATVTEATDLYGIGATLFYLLLGRPPRTKAGEQPLLAQLKSLTEQPAPQLAEQRGDVPPELNALVAELLDCDPSRRPANAVEVAERLAAWTDAGATERLREMLPPADETNAEEVDDSRQVALSLSELVGPAEAAHLLGETAPTPLPQASRRRPFAWLIGLAAMFAAAWAGIVLLIETPEGTLRIESEAAGVEVELLDENEQVTSLEIEQGENVTELKAGKYRVRLKGAHDKLSVTPKVIVLRDGEQVLARVTHIPKIQPRQQSVEQETPQGTIEVEREGGLYQGEPESVWQRRFEAETNPVAKIEAAMALNSLAQTMPEKEKLNRIMQTGSELLADGWGDEAPQMAFGNVIKPYFSPKRWSQKTYPKLGDQWRSYVNLLYVQLADVPAPLLANRLVKSVTTGTVEEASFAALLLAYQEVKVLVEQDSNAGQQIVSDFRRDDPELLKRTCLLIRAEYSYGHEEYPTAVLNKLREEMAAVGERFAKGPIAESDKQFVQAWFSRASNLKMPTQLLAEVSFQQLVDFGKVWRLMPVKVGSEFPYSSPRYQRSGQQDLVSYWLPLANDWMANHLDAAESSSFANVLQTYSDILRVRRPIDDWPVEQTAEIMTKLYREAYGPQAGQEDDTPIAKRLPFSPNELLADIILCGEDLPEVAKQPSTNPKVKEKHEQLLRLLRFETSNNKEYFGNKEKLAGLIQSAPYETVKTIIQAERLPQLQSRLNLIKDASTVRKTNVLANGRTQVNPPVEPLLLLAILTDLTGKSEAIDDRIIELIQPPVGDASRFFFIQHISDALNGDFAVRQIAEKWLRRMRERAVSEELRKRIDELAPGLSSD